jgi:hypothetical protein
MVSLESVTNRYNISAKSVQKETASLFKRDCRARAAHPGAVDYIVVKQSGFVTFNRLFAECFVLVYDVFNSLSLG